jgi:hypothetical protein
MKTVRCCTVLVFFLAVCTAFTFADEPGRHPAYLHALSDLRAARANLDRMTPSEHVDDEQARAIEEIDKAIREIKDAAINDGKDLNDHPPIDEHMDRRGRFHRALELLDKAHHDVDYKEDDPSVRGLRDRSLHHIDEAHHIVEHVIQQSGW